MAAGGITTSKTKIHTLATDKLPALMEAAARLRQIEAERDALLSAHDWQLRFFSHVDVQGPDECWPWQGHKQQSGHGRFQTSRFEKSGAHQIAYLLMVGPIPGALVVCHACDNPWCCNPKHLWLGTIADNNRDCWAKGRRRMPRQPKPEQRARGQRNAKAKLTEEQVQEILRATGSNIEVGRRFGVNDRSVSMIRTGKTWKHVPRSI